MVELDGTGDYLRKQRLENDVVLPVHERDFGLLQLALREHLAEMDRDIDSAESAAKNENAFFCHADWSRFVRDPYRGSWRHCAERLPSGSTSVRVCCRRASRRGAKLPPLGTASRVLREPEEPVWPR